ncbi:hypothetical protein ACNKHO_01095 [Shigella flexneri]
MSIYQRYLANESPVPLNLVAPEDIVDMGVDGPVTSFAAVVRSLPVWTTDPDALCQQSQGGAAVGNPFDQSSQPQQQQQQPQQQEEKKDSDGVAGWIRICSAELTSCGYGRRLIIGFFHPFQS